jgi:cephalosporin-C deacetylase-like acetyl esterase
MDKMPTSYGRNKQNEHKSYCGNEFESEDFRDHWNGYYKETKYVDVGYTELPHCRIKELSVTRYCSKNYLRICAYTSI